MKQVIYSCLLVVFFLASCAKEDATFLYSGEYLFGEHTTVVRNNGPVADIETYSDASVYFQVQTGNECLIVLSNLITGQPHVEILGTFETSYNESNEEEVLFSGKGETEDREVEVHGVICDTLLTELYIQETITSEIVGGWILSSINATFYDGSENQDLVNDILNLTFNAVNDRIASNLGIEDLYIDFSSYGYVNSYLAPESLIEYYLRPEKSILNFYIDKSVTALIFNSIKENQSVMEYLDYFGISSILELRQSLSLPIYYSITGGELILTMDQSLLDFYISISEDVLAALSSRFETMTSFEEISDEITGTIWESIITPDNFEDFRTAALTILDALDPDPDDLPKDTVEYSININLKPYQE